MTKTINLYYDESEKTYYFNDEHKLCDCCSEIIENAIVIRVFWDRLRSGVNYLCFDCKNGLSASDRATCTETYIAIVTMKVPRRAIIVPFMKPMLSDSRNTTTLDIASINVEGEVVKDKTVYANRPSTPVVEYVIEKERSDIDLRLGFKPLKDDELELFFENVKDSKQLVRKE